jgi:hypothetical protein
MLAVLASQRANTTSEHHDGSMRSVTFTNGEVDAAVGSFVINERNIKIPFLIIANCDHGIKRFKVEHLITGPIGNTEVTWEEQESIMPANMPGGGLFAGILAIRDAYLAAAYEKLVYVINLDTEKTVPLDFPGAEEIEFDSDDAIWCTSYTSRALFNLEGDSIPFEDSSYCRIS